MGTCAFPASPNFWGLEVLIVPGSPPEAWPGLSGGDRWRKAGKVSLLAFLSQGACRGRGLRDAPLSSRRVSELDPQDSSLRAAGGCTAHATWSLALGVEDMEWGEMAALGGWTGHLS